MSTHWKKKTYQIHRFGPFVWERRGLVRGTTSIPLGLRRRGGVRIRWWHGYNTSSYWFYVLLFFPMNETTIFRQTTRVQVQAQWQYGTSICVYFTFSYRFHNIKSNKIQKKIVWRMLIARRGEKISLDFSFPSSPSTSLDLFRIRLGWNIWCY